MHINCPECSSVFEVSSDALGGDGRKVKCAKCKHVWHQKPDNSKESEEEKNTEAAADQKADSSLESVDKDEKNKEATNESSKDSTKKDKILTKENILAKIEHFVHHFHFGLKASTVVLTFFCILLYSITSSDKLINSMSFLKGYYHLLGIYSLDGVAMYDLNVESSEVEGEDGNNIKISGKIQNDTVNIRYLPDLRVVAYDQNDDVLQEVFFYSDHQAILPEKSIDFENTLTNLSAKPSRVVLDIGNWVDLSGR